MLKRILVIAGAVLAGFGLAQLANRHAAAPSWWPDRERDKQVKYYREVMQLVKENYVGDAPADYASLTRSALDGMVGQLDPHSQFMLADEYSQTEDELTNAFTGVGIQVEQRDNHIVIVAAIPATPAERAGIRRGDQLVKIDGQALVNPTLDSTIKLVRGEPGSLVTLTVFRPSLNKNFDYTVHRERIQLDSVRLTSVLPGRIGYLQITQFSDRTGDEFQGALASLEKEGIDSLIIDLRGCTDKDALLDAVCARYFENLDAEMQRAAVGQSTTLDVLRAQGQAYVRFALANPGVYRIATMDEGHPRRRRRQHAHDLGIPAHGCRRPAPDGRGRVCPG